MNQITASIQEQAHCLFNEVYTRVKPSMNYLVDDESMTYYLHGAKLTCMNDDSAVYLSLNGNRVYEKEGQLYFDNISPEEFVVYVNGWLKYHYGN